MPNVDRRRIEPTVLQAFVALCGERRWDSRVAELGQQIQKGVWRGRAVQQRHALELMLARAHVPDGALRVGPAEKRALAFADEAVRLARSLPPGPRARLD